MKGQISVEKLPPVAWKEVPVVTTELLAKVYGTDSKHIQNNYSRNTTRFEEGKHFFKLSGSDLADLRTSLRGSQISAKVRSLILWTERGAARHAKMLETEQAWEVYEKLEDCYFHRHDLGPAEGDEELSTVRDREPLLSAAVTLVVRHRLPFNIVYQTMNYFAGSMRFATMKKDQVKEVARFVERFLTGNDTRQDWLRIEQNRRAIAGDTTQPELIGFVVPGVFGAK